MRGGQRCAGARVERGVSKAQASPRGTWQHYLPASYLAEFSSDVSTPWRRRRLWVRRLDVADPYVKSAETLARERGLYDATSGPLGESLGPVGTADVAWGYERNLPAALERLHSDRPLDGHLWLTTVVPFVAGLFVRAPGFQQEFTQRFPVGADELSGDVPNNATVARLIDFQLLLAPLLAARWTVLHFSTEVELVTSDRGFALTSTPLGTDPSYVVPTGRHTAVVVTPQICGQPLHLANGRWLTNLAHVHAQDIEGPGLKRAIGAFARDEVYGPTREAVTEASRQLGEAPTLGAELFESLDPASHLYDYFRLLSVLASGPCDAQSRADSLDWSTISESDWTSPVVIELLFPDRTRGGVRVEDEHVTVDLAYGVAIHKDRRRRGDFRMGALALSTLSNLGKLGAKNVGGQPSLT